MEKAERSKVARAVDQALGQSAVDYETGRLELNEREKSNSRERMMKGVL